MISLQLFSRLKQNNPPVFMDDLTGKVDNTWKRSITKNGGYWLGEFTLTGPSAVMAAFFYENLGCHVQEKSGGYITWEGQIYEMELTIGGVARRRSLSVMGNYVTAMYTDPNDTTTAGKATPTAAATMDQAIKQYGRREELLLLDGMPLAVAQSHRDTYLKENAWPWARTVSAGMGYSDTATLVVTVSGYVYTANWRYISTLPGSTVNISTWIAALLSDCEFLTPGTIHANTLQVVESLTTPQRVWDKLIELLALGDAAGNPWRIYVDQSRTLNYELVDNTPVYYLRNGSLVSISGESTDQVDPWRIKPGVVRDMDYPVKKNELGAWLADARDFYVSEVEVSMATGIPTLKTELFSEADILTAQEHYRKTLEQAAKTASAKASTGSAAKKTAKKTVKTSTQTQTSDWKPPVARPGATKAT